MVKRNATGPWWWMSDAEFTAQMAHFGWSAWIVLFASHWLGWYWPPLAMLVFGASKEFIFDVLPVPYGEGDTWLSSSIDFAFYFFGTCWGVLMVYLERM